MRKNQVTGKLPSHERRRAEQEPCDEPIFTELYRIRRARLMYPIAISMIPSVHKILVRAVVVVLWSAVQADVQPWHTAALGAQPCSSRATLSQCALHGFSDERPELDLLLGRCAAKKRRKVPILAAWTTLARRDEVRVAAKVCK